MREPAKLEWFTRVTGHVSRFGISPQRSFGFGFCLGWMGGLLLENAWK